MNILKKLKQLLKKFCVHFVQVKCGQIFIKIYSPFENLEGTLQNFDKI